MDDERHGSPVRSLVPAPGRAYRGRAADGRGRRPPNVLRRRAPRGPSPEGGARHRPDARVGRSLLHSIACRLRGRGHQDRVREVRHAAGGPRRNVHGTQPQQDEHHHRPSSPGGTGARQAFSGTERRSGEQLPPGDAGAVQPRVRGTPQGQPEHHRAQHAGLRQHRPRAAVCLPRSAVDGRFRHVLHLGPTRHAGGTARTGSHSRLSWGRPGRAGGYGGAPRQGRHRGRSGGRDSSTGSARGRAGRGAARFVRQRAGLGTRRQQEARRCAL